MFDHNSQPCPTNRRVAGVSNLSELIEIERWVRDLAGLLAFAQQS
jgi:hypothetical protein